MVSLPDARRKIPAEDLEGILRELESGKTQQEIADRYGVNRRSIGRACARYLGLFPPPLIPFGAGTEQNGNGDHGEEPSAAIPEPPVEIAVTPSESWQDSAAEVYLQARGEQLPKEDLDRLAELVRDVGRMLRADDDATWATWLREGFARAAAVPGTSADDFCRQPWRFCGRTPRP